MWGCRSVGGVKFSCPRCVIYYSSVISVPLWFDFLELVLKFNSKIFLTRTEVPLPITGFHRYDKSSNGHDMINLLRNQKPFFDFDLLDNGFAAQLAL